MNVETGIEPLDTAALPPMGIARLMTAIVLVAAFAELSYTTVNISAMPVFIQAIGLPTHWIAMAGISFILVEGVLKSPFGVLGDRIGRKPLILAGPCVSIFTCLLTPHVHNPWTLVLLRILDGIGAAALWPAAFSLIGDYIPENRRANAMSFFNLAYLLGIALGPLLGGGVNDWTFRHLHVTWAQSKEASFYVASVLFAVTVVVAILFIPQLSVVKHERTDGGEGHINLAEFRAMLSRIPAKLLMTFVTFMGIGLIMLYFKVFTLQYFHFSEFRFGKLLIGPALIVAALAVPLGTLGDRIGKALAVKIGIATCAISYWIALLFFREWTLVVFGSLLGLGFIIAFPAWMALVSSDCDPSQRGAVIGAVGTAQGVGAIVGVFISGLLYGRPATHLGGIPIPAHGMPFIGCALMLTLATVIAVTTVHEAPHLETG